MKRVIGLYRIPWFPFFRGKLSRIEEMLSYQGKVVSVERQDEIEAASQLDADDDRDNDDEAHSGGEFDYDDSGSNPSDSELQ
jgi:hypothetical protein